LIENFFSFPKIQVNGRYIIARDSFIPVEKLNINLLFGQKNINRLRKKCVQTIRLAA
jgi:hypothetical protein